MTLLNQHLQHLTSSSQMTSSVSSISNSGSISTISRPPNVGIIGSQLSHHHQLPDPHMTAYHSLLNIPSSSSAMSGNQPHPILGQGVTLSSQIGSSTSGLSGLSQAVGTSATSQQQQQLNNKEMALLMATEANLKANNDREYYEAIKLYGMAIQLDPTDARFFLNRSYCYAQLELYQLALDDAEQAIRLEPKSGKCFFRRGQALVGLKKYVDAERSFQEVLKFDLDCQETVKELLNVRLLAVQSLGFDGDQARVTALTHSTIEEAVSFLLSNKCESSVSLSSVNEQQQMVVGPPKGLWGNSVDSTAGLDILRKQELVRNQGSGSVWQQQSSSSIESTTSSLSSMNGGRTGSIDSWTLESSINAGISSQQHNQSTASSRSVIESLTATLQHNQHQQQQPQTQQHLHHLGNNKSSLDLDDFGHSSSSLSATLNGLNSTTAQQLQHANVHSSSLFGNSTTSSSNVIGSSSSSLYSRTIERPNANNSSSLDKQQQQIQSLNGVQLVSGNNTVNSMLGGVGTNAFGPRLISGNTAAPGTTNGFLNSNVHLNQNGDQSVFDGSCIGKPAFNASVGSSRPSQQQQTIQPQSFADVDLQLNGGGGGGSGFLGNSLLPNPTEQGSQQFGRSILGGGGQHGTIGVGRHPSGGSTSGWGGLGSEPSISPSVSSDSSTSDFHHQQQNGHQQINGRLINPLQQQVVQQQQAQVIQQQQQQRIQQQQSRESAILNGTTLNAVQPTPVPQQTPVTGLQQQQQVTSAVIPSATTSAWGSSSSGSGSTTGTFADIVKKKGMGSAPASASSFSNPSGTTSLLSGTGAVNGNLPTSVASIVTSSSSNNSVTANNSSSNCQQIKTKGGGGRSNRDSIGDGGDHDNTLNNGTTSSTISNGSTNGTTTTNGQTNTNNSKRPTNIWGYNGLRVGNVSSSCPKSTLLSMFSKFGRVKLVDRITNKNVENQIWVFYDNPNSPVEAIAKYQACVIPGVSLNDSTPLKFYFAATDDQKDLKFSRPKQPQDNRGECYYWRTTNCFSRDACSLRHIPACKNIDAQVWMKMNRDSTSSANSN